MVSKEIECIQRLNDLTGCVDEIFRFLVDEKLATMEDIKAIRTSSYQSKLLQSFLKQLSVRDLIQMLEYEWTILPVERIKILIVTNRTSKEFTFNS